MAEQQAMQSVTIGGRSFTLAKLKLGQLRRNDALRDAVAGLQTMSGILGKGGELPTAAQFDTMLVIAHASAQATEPALTIEDFAAAIDGEEYDAGFLQLAQCVAIATTGVSKTRLSRASGTPVTGEAESPSSSTSDDSTGSSPRPPAGATETSTS